MLEPGAAVILDTETTDLAGAVVTAVAVVDPTTGATLLDTLVHPGDARISDGAFQVHGISDAAMTAHPFWHKVLSASAAAEAPVVDSSSDAQPGPSRRGRPARCAHG